MKVARNDPCPCGSGKKYKKCCLDKKQQPEISTHLLSLDERTNILYNAMVDIFQFRKCKDWNDVKKSFTEDRIREFYKVIAWLWKPNTDIGSILPKPDTNLRALYLGRYRPELILQNVIRYTLYTDEILVMLPFVNPWCVREDYDPIVNPNQYKEDTLRSVAMLHQLGPWVAAGLVKIIPDPGDFDYKLRISTWDMAKERVKDRKFSEEDMAEDMKIAKEEYMRMLYQLPPSSLKTLIKQAIPEIEGEKLDKMLKYMESKKKNDPLSLEEPPQTGKSSLLVFRTGANLEMGSYIAQLTGSYLYTDMKLRWEEILSVSGRLKGQGDIWSPLTKAFQSLDFKFLNLVDPNFACTLRKEERLASFRTFLRKIWGQVGGEADLSKVDSIARNFSD